MEIEELDYIIVGAGISGIFAARALESKGLNFKILDPNEVGGVVQSSISPSGNVIEKGPNSFAIDTFMNSQLGGFHEKIIPAKDTAKNRMILWNNKIVSIPMGPKMLFSGFLSLRTKLKLVKEIFFQKVKKDNQSVAEFVKNHFGEELLDKMIDPICRGIYAGDVNKLSVKEVFPILPKWEEKYGSVIKGAFKSRPFEKRKIVSYQGGLQNMLKDLSATFSDKFEQEEIREIEHKEDYYILKSNNKEWRSKNVIMATPAYVNYNLFPNFPEFPYESVTINHFEIEEKHITKNREGFGFLVPSSQNEDIMGCIFNSSIFSSLTDSNKRMYTVFSKPNMYGNEEIISEKIAERLRFLLKFSKKPTFIGRVIWNNAIPQYYFDHNLKRTAIPFSQNLHFVGNYIQEVAVGKLAKHSFESTLNFLKNK